MENKNKDRYKVDFGISWRNWEGLARFMNDRGRIIGGKRTGLSSQRQRKVARAIKQARFLGLLPYRPGV